MGEAKRSEFRPNRIDKRHRDSSRYRCRARRRCRAGSRATRRPWRLRSTTFSRSCKASCRKPRRRTSAQYVLAPTPTCTRIACRLTQPWTRFTGGPGPHRHPHERDADGQGTVTAHAPALPIAPAHGRSQHGHPLPFFPRTTQPSSQPRFGTISLPKGVRLGRQSIKYVRSFSPSKAP